MSSVVTVGDLSVEVFEGKTTAIITIGGARPTSINVGVAAGQRFFDALSKIRAALVAADRCQRRPNKHRRPVTPDEVELARLLVDLDIYTPR